MQKEAGKLSIKKKPQKTLSFTEKILVKLSAGGEPILCGKIIFLHHPKVK